MHQAIGHSVVQMKYSIASMKVRINYTLTTIRKKQRKQNGKMCHLGKELFLRREKLKGKGSIQDQVHLTLKS